jgi:hypothetical protein
VFWVFCGAENQRAARADSLRDVARNFSILEIFMPGAYGPQAVAETIFGDNVPGGKLPVSMYYSNYTVGLDIDDMSMKGRTYRYFDGPVVFPFGHGISGWHDTTFRIQWSSPPISNAVFRAAEHTATYNVTVTNTGTVDADEVVLLFLKPRALTIPSLRDTGTPIVIKQLIDFERIRVGAGASRGLSFTVNGSESLGLVDNAGHTSLHPGEYEAVFSRGCVGCDELVTTLTIDAPSPIRLKTFRNWGGE